METVNAPTFRLRRGGRIAGPFSRTHIRLMARRGEVLLTDELSLNGGQWLPVIRTPLAQEVTRKPGITLSSPSSGAGHAGDTAIAPAIPLPRPVPPPAPKPKAPPKPAPRPAPVRQEAPPPPPPPQTDDPLAGWETTGPSYASRHRRRRPVKRSGGGLEVFLLVALAVVALGIIAFVVFRFSRGDSTASAPRGTKPPASGPAAPAAAPAVDGWKAFVGRTYGLWESQNATGPALRFHLMADGRVETLGNAPVDVPSAVDRWAVASGELTLVNDKGMATYRFPAQADQRELTGTFYGKKWRKLVLEGR